jgi:hypothetical protein
MLRALVPCVLVIIPVVVVIIVAFARGDDAG